MKNATMLVVDDSLTARMKIKESLELEGIRVLLAKDGAEGEAIARQNTPDVILLDVVLPDADGIELCEKWREDSLICDIPILLFSGSRPNSEDRAKGMRAGAMGYIVKPYNEDEMLAQLGLLYELGQTHKELKRQVEVAEEANRGKSNFLATMSHEIRTPLTAIMGFAETMLEKDITNDLRETAVSIIVKNGQHLLEVINDILDFSKIESGKFDVEIRDYSPFHAVNNVLALMEPKAREKGIYLRSEYTNALPELIATDSTRLKQILLNLVSNAIKFTHAGGVTVAVECKPEVEKIYFEVRDTGIGMSPEQSSQLFQAFSQADASISRRFGGTGLGLVIAKEISEKLGGEVTVESVEGEGTIFTASISTGSLDSVTMLDQPPKAEAPDSSWSLTAAQNDNKLSLEGRVLVAEDGDANQRLVSHYLRKLGLEVVVVENGAIGVEKALSEDFSLILMDMQMPVMDGLTASRILRDKGYDKPIVALTANSMSHHIEECLAAGCDAHLPKPFSRAQFTSTVAQYVSESSSTVKAETEIIFPEDFEEDLEYCKIIAHFVDGLPKRLANMEESLNDKNWGELKRNAHSLMAAGLFGYHQVSALVRSLDLAAEQESSEISADILTELNSLYSRIDAGKEELLKRVGL